MDDAARPDHRLAVEAETYDDDDESILNGPICHYRATTRPPTTTTEPMLIQPYLPIGPYRRGEQRVLEIVREQQYGLKTCVAISSSAVSWGAYMDAHGWNLAEMCQRYHHAGGVASAQQQQAAAAAASSPAREQTHTPGLQQQQQHIDQPSPSYSHYT
ncbi:hypothetical protein TKK_0013411 [Trichogramma kaykai]